MSKVFVIGNAESLEHAKDLFLEKGLNLEEYEFMSEETYREQVRSKSKIGLVGFVGHSHAFHHAQLHHSPTLVEGSTTQTPSLSTAQLLSNLSLEPQLVIQDIVFPIETGAERRRRMRKEKRDALKRRKK